MSTFESTKIWYDLDQLPSGGITYPKDWKISITPYSFGDVMKLTRSPESGIGAFDRILDGVKCNFDKAELLPQDVLYLGIYRKLVSTKHSKIEFKVECPVCAFENKKVMNMTELTFKELKIPKLPIVAPFVEEDPETGETKTLEVLHFEPLSYGKYKECLKAHKDDPSWLLAYSVTNMDSAKARDYIINASGMNLEMLEEVSDLLDFGLKPIEFECQEEFCQNVLHVALEDPTTIVVPFRSSGQSARKRIKFGNESDITDIGDTTVRL